MSRRTAHRISTNAAESLRTGLNAAFAKLDVPNVPPAAAPDAPARIWKMGRVVLRRETAHRGGKTVVVVHDFATHLPLSVIETIAKELRQACGCGGTVRGREVEIQGEQVGKIRELLEREGFQVAGVK